jgi:hypothetical protein
MSRFAFASPCDISLLNVFSIIAFVGTEKRREKVVVLRELQRVIIYTRELSKQAIEGHVSTAFIGYSVNEGARLTAFILCHRDGGTGAQDGCLVFRLAVP